MTTPGSGDEEGAVGGSEGLELEGVISGSLGEQFGLLKLRSQLKREELEAIREAREARQQEREARKEEEERQLKILSLQLEIKKFEAETQMRQMPPVQEQKHVVLMKMRDMRENEDIDDFFRVFEMTAKSQFVPKEQWLGSLIPRLSERAKSVYLEIKYPDAQDYDRTKFAILESYQLTIDHYRYKFRYSEKLPDEDFVQWARRTRRFLDRWMLVAEATGDSERILEQVTIERMLDAVSPELRAWLKEKKPETAEKLAKIANEHVQARKGPLVDGKYVSMDKYRMKRVSVPGEQRKSANTSSPERSAERSHASGKEEKKDFPRSRSIRCYKCKEMGHLSFNCLTKVNTTPTKPPGTRGLLCLTPLNNNEPRFPELYIHGFIGGKPAKMLVDTGCTRTLVHRNFVSKADETSEKITVLTATGERIEIPLAWVEMKVPKGMYKELVGIVENLPIDCLLGRSSYGRVVTRQHLLNQWIIKEEAFVMTRNQAKVKAQERMEELVDRENHMAAKTLRQRQGKLVQSGPSLDEPKNEANEESVTEPGKNDLKDDEECKVNILDRNLEQVISDQKSDITLAQCKRVASNEAPEEKDGYYIKKKLLMHRKFSLDTHDGLPYTDRIVVPESYRTEILRMSHTIPLAGHLGKEKTMSRISAHFYWPRLSFDVGKYCATCPECQLVARKRTALRAPLRSVPIETEPFRKIAIDITGELPRSKTGNKYILTIVDYATRYPEAFPLRTTHSKAIADALMTYFSRMGIPEEIVSDQGANLIGKLMTQLFEHLGITRIKTSVYHPEANGLVERFNGTLKQMLRKFVSENVGLWDKYLPYLLFAYREVPCPSTGYSPFELLYGRTVRGPLAVIKETWMEKDSPQPDLITYVIEMRRRMTAMQEAVSQNMMESQAKQKRYYDKKSSVRTFEVRDKVLVLLPTPGNKLETKWHGPYPITRVKDDRTYEIDTGQKNKQLRSYNINLLSLWQSSEEATAFVIKESQEMTYPHEKSLPQLGNDETWHNVIISNDLNEEQRTEVQELLKEFSDVFSGKPNLTNVAVHQIDTGDAKPIRCSPYKIPQRLEKAVRDEIDKMLEMNIIRPSVSPWSFPVVIVPKPDGSIRFCVDYRKLNAITKMDAYPIPRIEKMIERVSAAKFITTLDLTKGYWQIPLEQSTIEKSAFITSRGLYECLVMPFGMKTAPATFQRMMTERVLKGLQDFTDAYIDDVEIDTDGSFTQHLDEVRLVLQRLRDCHLNARPSKCKVGMLTVDFVGHRVGNGTIKPREALVQTIARFPVPQTKKDVRSFLGLVGYYRKFIPNFSERAAILTDLTKGNRPTKVKWDEKCEKALCDLKNALVRAPVLSPPKWDKEFIVQVDASNRGLGAILSQKDDQDNEHPIVYASRKLQPREEKLSTTEKECLAIVWAIELLRYYLFGRHFVLQTDHNPLVWLSRVRDKSRKLLRWSLSLQEYDLEIQHKSGKKNVNVDVLSRL